MDRSAPGVKAFAVTAFLSWAVIFGPAYNAYLDFHFTHSSDARSYLDMAEGNLNVNPVHRYRVLVPWAAAAVAKAVSPFYHSLWQFRGGREWPFRFGFLLVNSVLVGLAGAFVFAACRAYGGGTWSAAVATVGVLSSRFADDMAALPLTDSLYLLVLCMTLYGLRTRHAALIVTATLLGPLTKESFVFVVPILFLGPLGWRRQSLAVAGAALLALTLRWGIDHHLGKSAAESWNSDLSHFNGLGYSLQRLCLHRLGEKLSVLGGFTAVILAGWLGGRAARRAWLARMDAACLGMALVILVHVLLSGDVGRMLFLGAPVWAVAMALILEYHPWFAGFRRAVNPGAAGTTAP